jgi:3-hydroxybutyryl-CoA dehydrogenase
VTETIGIVGAGIMGSGIAQMFAEQGRSVFLWDADPDRLEAGLSGIRARLQRSAEKGNKPPQIVDAVLDRIAGVNCVDELADVDLALEAVTENLQIKQEVLAELSATVREWVILATNTSSLSIEELSTAVRVPGRFLGMHFFNPPTKLELVELVPASGTSETALETARGLLKSCGKTSVTVRDTPGFIVNRLLLILINEAARMLDEGVATADDIDAAMRLGALHPIGPLGLADLIGLDTCEVILNELRDKLGSGTYAPAHSLQQRVGDGRLGRKTGEGFFSREAEG